MLYAFGSNGAGQLGVGHEKDLFQPEAISEDAQSTWTVRAFATGGNHTIILCSDGKVRATGSLGDGTYVSRGLGQTDEFFAIPIPGERNLWPNIRPEQLSASWSSSTLLCLHGELYTMGSGNGGELGSGPEITNEPSFHKIQPFAPRYEKVVSIASGMAHTVAILSNGEVYGWGKGRKGQLGEPSENVWLPRKITSLDFPAVEAACGKDFTIVASEAADGRFAILGPHSNDRFRIRANAPESLKGWKSIVATWGSIYVLNTDGDIVAWGRDDHGQLPPRDLPKIKAIAGGSEHCIALTKAGKVLAWGWGEHGNCGSPTQANGDVKEGWNEIKVAGRVTNVFAGCATSFVEVDELDEGSDSG